jgi:hypothetical protein
MGMMEKGLENQVKNKLEDLFSQVPFVRLKRWQREARTPEGRQVDLSAEILAKGEPWRIVVEVKSSGEPRYIRGAVQQLRSLLSDKRRAYGIVSAPYISTDAGKICMDEGMGYLDLAGNCGLNFANLFIERHGIPKPPQERRPLRSLYAPKAGRLLRVLLEEPEKPSTLQALAEKAGVSLGLAFKVKQRLLDFEFAAQGNEGLVLSKPEELLRQWGANYSFTKNDAFECYSQGDLPQLEAALAGYCRKAGTQYAFTLFSGAARVAPYARYLKGAAYVTGDPSEIAKKLEWKPVSSGANFTLLRPYDDGVFYGVREINKESVASDVQLYLDLIGSKARGEEAATFLLEQRLRSKW